MRRGLSIAIVALAAAAACSSEDDGRPGALMPIGGTSGASGQGNDGGRSGTQNNDAGSPGSSGEGGDGPSIEGCGDGVRVGEEQCDGEDLGALDCVALGFISGELTCKDDCTADSSDCLGVENCGDGLDNDGDVDVDCDDDDCAATCDDPCAEPPVLPDPAAVSATTAERGDVIGSSCVVADGGPEVAYSFVAAKTGTLEIALESTFEMGVSVYTACGASSVDLACSDAFLSLAVTAGDELFIVVESTSPGEAGEFSLTAFSRENEVCGDGFLDPGEGCDDGNEDFDDGCDDNCVVESVEDEPNADSGQATVYDVPHFAEISPAGDVDWVEVTVPSDVSSIVAEVNSVNEDCYQNKLDSLVSIFDGDGTTELVMDDDSGSGKCSRAVATGLDSGTYYVRISEFGDDATFPYELVVTVNRCGDSLQGPGEQCDDGDTSSGDGCSSTCQDE
jgi:cysteine-rich repeat protein